MLADAPAHIREKIQRILDQTAREMLAEKLARELREAQSHGSIAPVTQSPAGC